MTNAVAIVSVTLITNTIPFLHPSGEQRVVQRCVSERHEVVYWIGTNRFQIVTNIPIATNLVRQTWTDTPLIRQPLGVPDFPMPK